MQPVKPATNNDALYTKFLEETATNLALPRSCRSMAPSCGVCKQAEASTSRGLSQGNLGYESYDRTICWRDTGRLVDKQRASSKNSGFVRVATPPLHTSFCFQRLPADYQCRCRRGVLHRGTRQTSGRCRAIRIRNRPDEPQSLLSRGKSEWM